MMRNSGSTLSSIGGYGTAWGGVRGLLDVIGLRGAIGTAVHFALIWGAEQVFMTKLQISPPITEWPPQEVAVDGFHHFVYAQGTGAAYDRLRPPVGSRPR